MKETIEVGLIKGRHDMPQVNEYIFNGDIEDVHDYTKIGNTILDFIRDKVKIDMIDDIPLNGVGISTVRVYRGKRKLIVYVTGLTMVVAELIRMCAIYGVELTLMNYDTKTQTYKRQIIF